MLNFYISFLTLIRIKKNSVLFETNIREKFISHINY